MIIDLHAHTNYSFCGRDEPEILIREMIRRGVEFFGVTDHNYGVGDRKEEYCKQINRLKRKYADKIQIFCGVEISTISQYFIDENEDLSMYDYALIEYLDDEENSVLHGDIISFAKKYAIPMGIAHTDLFAFIKRKGWNAEETLANFAKNGIFCEMNVNYDSIHNFREHSYVLEFLRNKEQQEMVKKSNIQISVGFDGHKVEDYDVQRVTRMCDFLEERNISIFLPKDRDR